MGGDAVQPGTKGRFPAVKGGKCPENRQKNVLRQIQGILLVTQLTVCKAIYLVIVGPNQLVRRLPGASALNVPNPLLFLSHCLTALYLSIYS